MNSCLIRNSHKPSENILVLRRVPSSCKRILNFLHQIVGIHKKILKYSFQLLVVYTVFHNFEFPLHDKKAST